MKSQFKNVARLIAPPFLIDSAKLVRQKVAIFARTRKVIVPTSGAIQLRLMGIDWRLDMGSCITRSMVESGVWEPNTTKVVKEYVRPGMNVLSVGANFGYYAMIMAKLVGPSGHVWAFEPTAHFREQLQWHIDANSFGDRVTVLPFGLSDSAQSHVIQITPQSASMHYGESVRVVASETIELRPFDAVAKQLGISRIDFISMDIDGHEAAFLKGAKETLSRDLPPITMEFAQRCLHLAGSDVLEVHQLLADIGYVVCSEITGKPFRDEMDFLTTCGNFSHDSNALAVRRSLAN